MNLPLAMPTVKQTVLRSAAVLAVCAAVASFSHIYSFARAAGQTPAIAVLYPGSTDVLVACATACLLHASRNKPLKATFARWAFAVGVAATVAANIGDHFRPIPFAVGAAVSGWPAVSFVLAVVLVHWFWNSGTGNLTVARQQEEAQTGRFPVEGPPEPVKLHPEATPITARPVTIAKRDGEPAQDPGTGNLTAAHRQEGAETGNLPVSKTERVRAELQAARERGENPTAADLVKSLLEQGHEISPTLARNIVRENKVASNGSSS